MCLKTILTSRHVLRLPNHGHHSPATGDLSSTESPYQSQAAPETSSSWERLPVPMTTAMDTWGPDELCHRSVDGHLASSSSDGTGRCSGHGHPWQYAVHGRCTGIPRTHTQLDHVHSRRTSAQRSRFLVKVLCMDHSPKHTHKEQSVIFMDSGPLVRRSAIPKVHYSEACVPQLV